ncbi:MAG: orotidine-5'-phosphate decarboxylase [Propionibacteriaceae bacterium]|jgi:orotidine-5'-phosphate decarboxylase|nr:orotidine-5'-phosphate decarboxylase [Propionibacteriaceae bacterium]
MKPYAQRLRELVAIRKGICVGIDPHPALLDRWGLAANSQGLEAFSRGVVEVLGSHVAVFKPQSAFFECFGSAGIAALERVLQDISGAGALSILDVKRGDIGSTMRAYAAAYLSDDSPLSADAITLSPFLGYESLAPAFEKAYANGRGIYVLARTSNPEGEAIQLAHKGLYSVAQGIVDGAAKTNSQYRQDVVGLVIGATIPDLQLDLSFFGGSILAPGIGAQGGKISNLPDTFGAAFGQVLPMVGRSVLAAGPDRDKLVGSLSAIC